MPMSDSTSAQSCTLKKPTLFAFFHASMVVCTSHTKSVLRPLGSAVRRAARLLRFACMVLGTVAGLAACSCQEEQAGVGVTGYNHTSDRSIYTFSVNGSMGAGMGPQEGGAL